jgi:3-hydroxyisobutyryl-CoA hydrolase
MPETAIGFFTDMGVASHVLSRLDNHIGYYLSLCGNRVKGDDNRRLGIATHYMNSKKLQSLEQELCCSNGLTSDKVDSILNKYNEKVEGEFSAENIKNTFNGSSVEDIIKKLKNDNSEWSQKQLKLMNRMSPSALKVVFKLLGLGSKLSLADCLKLEHQLTLQFMTKSKDFKEGVRALLIDKDNSPKWEPASLDEVTEELIEKFFEPIEDKFKLNI